MCSKKLIVGKLDTGLAHYSSTNVCSCRLQYQSYYCHVLIRSTAGERLSDSDVDQIFKFTGTEEDLDGNVKYEGNL